MEFSSSHSVIFEGLNKPLIFKDLLIPQLNDSEILVENEYTTLCRSDINTFTGKRTEKTPTILSHEIVGRIKEIQENHKKYDERGEKLNIGDRITWGIYASDPESYYSNIGIPQKAENLFKYGHEELTEGNTLNGGLSEFCIIRKHTPVIKISENLPLPVASIINCAVATVSGGFRLIGEVKGKNILISGAGMLGIIGCSMAKYLGAANVIAVDIDETRLETARRFGADFTVKASDNSEVLKKDIAEQADNNLIRISAVLELSGSALAMETTINLLDIGGIAVLIGATFPQREIKIDAEKIIRRIWTIKGLHNYNSKDLVTAVDFIENNYKTYPFEELIHDKFSLKTTHEAFEYAVKNNPHRVGIRIK